MLVEGGALDLAAGSTVAQLGDRTRRILFALSRTRQDAIAGLRRMFRQSSHVAKLHAGPSALSAALDEIRYRR